MEPPASSHQRNTTNFRVQDSPTAVSNKHNIIDESRIKPFAANKIVRPFNWRSKLDKKTSNSQTGKYDTDPNGFPAVLCNPEDKEYKKSDTFQVQQKHHFESSGSKNSQHNNRHDTTKMSIGKGNYITRSPELYSRNAVDKRSSKLITEKSNTDPQGFSAMYRKQEDKEYRKTDTNRVQKMNNFESINSRNSPHNNTQNLRTVSYKEYPHDKSKMPVGKGKYIASNPEFYSMNTADKKSSKLVTGKSITDEQGFSAMYRKQESKEYRRTDTKQVQKMNNFKSINSKNSPHNNSQNLRTVSYKEYPHDKSKMTVEKNPIKSDYEDKNMASKPKFHGIQEPNEPAVLKVSKVDVTLNNTSKYAESETHPVEKNNSFRYCTPDCKGAHKKIMTEKQKKKHDRNKITTEEKNILLRSCANRIKEGDYETAYCLSEIIAASTSPVQFEMGQNDLFVAPILLTKPKNKRRSERN